MRRYQNEDGTLTELGKKRYAKAPYDMDSVETSIANRMDSLGKKYEANLIQLRNFKLIKGDPLLQPILVRDAQRKGEKIIKQMEAGGKMLESYQKMSEKQKERIRDDTRTNREIKKKNYGCNW